MYKMKLWDEDKWNIHSSSYNSSSKYVSLTSDDKKEDKKYHEQRYGVREKNIASDYMRREEGREKEDKGKHSIFGELEEETKSERNEKENIKEDEIPFKAAKQVFDESRYETKKDARRKNVNSIEEAIKKAIEEEKKVIILD